jgi:GNAT superfamily N-acetyltransferase
LAEGNQLREVILPPDGSLDDAWNEAAAAYDARGLPCHRWVPAAGTPVEPLERFLTGRGFTRRRYTTMVWTDPRDLPLRDDTRVLPARAMRQACRQLRLDDTRYDPATRELLADSRNERLDDPQYDQLIVMAGATPVATGVLLQVGDIGRIDNIFVAEPFRRQGYGLTLMAHLLALSRRLALRITVLELEEHNEPARALYTRCGFEPAGTRVEFVAPSSP